MKKDGITISYRLSGEGRGHATRARTLVEALRDDHQSDRKHLCGNAATETAIRRHLHERPLLARGDLLAPTIRLAHLPH